MFNLKLARLAKNLFFNATPRARACKQRLALECLEEREVPSAETLLWNGSIDTDWSKAGN